MSLINDDLKDSDEQDIADQDVEDEAARESSKPTIYGISSYGADYDVEGLVKRMRSGAFVVPEFQRAYVWSQPKASRFIESLLLGLPIPSIFLYKEEDSGKHLIVDGLQRLKTLQFFYNGRFGERNFRLAEVQEPWNGATYEDLFDADRQALDDAIIHTIIFKQDLPSNDKSSIYHVFERLNTGGMRLYPQEIRNCVSHGGFARLLAELNEDPRWRAIYGPKNKRLKDQELILRFLALLFDKTYSRPMVEFLNSFMYRYRSPDDDSARLFSVTFRDTIALTRDALGERAFRPERALNAAVFDAVMVGLATRLQDKDPVDISRVRRQYDELLQNADFKEAYTRSTADEDSVATRLKLATAAFAEA